MSNDNKGLNQADVDALVKQAQEKAGQVPAAAPATPAPATQATATRTKDGPAIPLPDVEYLLDQAQQAIASVDAPVDSAVDGIERFEFRDFGGAPASSEKATLELLRDVELALTIELGRSQMQLEDVLKLRKGSVVALDKLAGDPVDVYVNGRLIARGEVLVMNDNFCVRIAELVSGDDRI